MGVIDLFSKRKRAEEGRTIDVFVYDEIPRKLRVQVIQILQDSFGSGYQADDIWGLIHKGLAREYGRFTLGKPHHSDYAAVANYMLDTSDADEVLDFIELGFRVVDGWCRERDFQLNTRVKLEPDDAIEELNTRFLENGVGYAFIEGKIIRKDSEVIHRNVVLPAIKLLQDKRYSGANDEYLAAHEHYRNGRYKECLNDCLKAFESTMKAICKIKKWKYTDRDTAKTLIDICFANNLIPAFLQSEVGSLRSALEGGIPTVRNRLGGHGQGPTPVEVPDYFASYLLGLTASTITLLVNAAAH
jgi:hypothetical protein